jgi:hypothetical protein
MAPKRNIMNRVLGPFPFNSFSLSGSPSFWSGFSKLRSEETNFVCDGWAQWRQAGSARIKREIAITGIICILLNLLFIFKIPGGYAWLIRLI